MRTPLPPAALAIGAIVPDLLYYVPLGFPRWFTHSWLGVVSVNLALGLVLFFLWQYVFRAPVIDFAPRWVRRRMPAEFRMPTTLRASGTFAALLIGAVLLGSTTHLVWDSLTHAGPVADALGLDAAAGAIPLYTWGKHVSSAVGALVLAVFVLVWTRRTAPREAAATRLSPEQRRNGTLLMLASAVVVAFAVWIRGMQHGWSAFDGELIFYTVTIVPTAAALCAVILSIVWWTVRRPRLH